MWHARPDFTADSLSAFAFDVSYDASILGFSSASYGSFLGDLTTPAAASFTTPSPGVLNLSEFSFLLDTELDALQPSSFTLATVVFNGLLAGNSALSFGGVVDLSDALGFSLATTTTSGDITVNGVNTTPPTNAVDEPPVLLLVLISLFG